VASTPVIKALIDMLARGGKQGDEAVRNQQQAARRAAKDLQDSMQINRQQHQKGHTRKSGEIPYPPRDEWYDEYESRMTADLVETDREALQAAQPEDSLLRGADEALGRRVAPGLNPERLPDTTAKRAQRNDPDLFDREEAEFIDAYEDNLYSRPGGPEELTEHDWLFTQLMDQLKSGEQPDPVMLKRLDELVPEWGEEVRDLAKYKQLAPFQSADKTPEALALFNSGLDDIANNRGLPVIVPKLQKLRQMDQQLGDELFNELIGDASSSPISASDILPDDIIPF
jgi:hypothetical protein